MHSQVTHKIYQPEKKIYMSYEWKQLVTKKKLRDRKYQSVNSCHNNINN